MRKENEKMSLNTGKTKKELEELKRKNIDMFGQGDISEQYTEMIMGFKPEDLEVSKTASEKMEEKLQKMPEDRVFDIVLDKLSPSPMNSFAPPSDEKKAEMISSLSTVGQITPIIIRPKSCVENYEIDTDFEILVGHTRVSCLKELKKRTAKAVVVNCNDIDASLLIAQSNIQREKISDIERARALKNTYQMFVNDKKTNLKKRWNFNDSSKSQSETSREIEGRTDEWVAQMYGMSRATLYRKMALADCTDRVVKCYEQKKITQDQIQHISKLDEEVQEQMLDVMKEKGIKKLTDNMARQLHEAYDAEKENPTFQNTFPLNTTRKALVDDEDDSEANRKDKPRKYEIPNSYFPKGLLKKDRVKYILKALEYAAKHDLLSEMKNEETVDVDG